MLPRPQRAPGVVAAQFRRQSSHVCNMSWAPVLLALLAYLTGENSPELTAAGPFP